MLRFLKNLRSQEFKGRLSRYLLYAVGEVTLVVIGILIAVRIDNWNDSRKKEEAFYDVLGTVARDLTEDIWQYEYQIYSHERKDSLLTKIISGQLKAEDYRQSWSELQSLIVRFVGFYAHEIGFQAVRQNLDNTPKEMKNLVDELNDYYLYKAFGVNHVFEREERYVWKTLDDWEGRYSWYSAASLNTEVNEEMLSYLVNSIEYRNKAAIFQITVRNALGVLRSGRMDGLDLFRKIRATDPEKRDSTAFEIAQLLNVSDTIEFQSCAGGRAQPVVQDENARRSIFIVRNNSGVKLRIYQMDNEAGEYEAEVAPGDFALAESVDNQWFELRNSAEECVGAFKAIPRHAVVEIQ